MYLCWWAWDLTVLHLAPELCHFWFLWHRTFVCVHVGMFSLLLFFLLPFLQLFWTFQSSSKLFWEFICKVFELPLNPFHIWFRTFLLFLLLFRRFLLFLRKFGPHLSRKVILRNFLCLLPFLLMITANLGLLGWFTRRLEWHNLSKHTFLLFPRTALSRKARYLLYNCIIIIITFVFIFTSVWVGIRCRRWRWWCPLHLLPVLLLFLFLFIRFVFANVHLWLLLSCSAQVKRTFNNKSEN